MAKRCVGVLIGHSEAPDYWITPADAEQRLALPGYREESFQPWLIRYFPAGETVDKSRLIGGATMREAWRVMESDGYFVWQMPSRRVRPGAYSTER